ncbi:MAG: PAS domain S-box protein [Fibrobacteria bacterium]|nr:PAS domain S-box protein [Fibrobacteria bacterium]
MSSLINSAFNQAVYAICLTDLDGKLLHVNHAYLKLYKIESVEELIGKTQRFISSPKTPKVVYQQMWQMIESNRNWNGEITNLDSEGREVFIHLNINPIFKNGEKIGYMGFSLDRSQQVMMEKQLLHANKLVVLGTLGAGLAHELNNPLTSISLEAEYIQEAIHSFQEMEHLDQLKAASNSILMSVERMNRVIEHLLVYSRKDDGEDMEIVSMNAVISDSFLFLDKQLKNRDIQVKIEKEEELKVYGHRMDMESVIHNLLTNARDAFHKSRTEEKLIKLKLSRTDDDWMMIEYWDNAGGIPPEIIEKIYDPFFTTKVEGEGTGLGLAITKKIVVASGGMISCESENGETRFIIRLPLIKENVQ